MHLELAQKHSLMSLIYIVIAPSLPAPKSCQGMVPVAGPWLRALSVLWPKQSRKNKQRPTQGPRHEQKLMSLSRTAPFVNRRK